MTNHDLPRDPGMEARWYVRGGLDPAYATPDARDGVARFLATNVCPDVAAAFLQGWVEHHPTEPDAPRWPVEVPFWSWSVGAWQYRLALRDATAATERLGAQMRATQDSVNAALARLAAVGSW